MGRTVGAETGSHVSNAVCVQVLDFVARRAGPRGVDRVRELAGESRPMTELRDLTAWSSWLQGRALLEAAAEVLGDSAALRNVVDEWVRVDAPGEIITLLQTLGSPASVLSAMPAIAAKFSPVVAMEPVSVGSGEAAIAATSVPGFRRYQELCDFTAGLLAIVPRLFGFDAALVDEEQCQVRGDHECLFRVSWREVVTSPDQEIAFLRSELDAMAGRLDSFRHTARDLVSGQDLESLLGTITERAATAVRAPAYLLAVVADDDADERVHHRGLTPQAVDDLLTELHAGAVVEDPSRLVVDIGSGVRQYGWLVALYPDGGRFLPEERHLLTAYAELAAAAVDAGTALARARREHATAQALLDLATDFSTVTSGSEVAERLVRAIPRVVACDFSTVHLYDADGRALVPAALHGFPVPIEQMLLATPVTVDDTPAVGQMLDRREPLFVDTSTDDGFLRAMLAAAGAAAFVAVPVVRQEDFYGVVTAAVADRPERLRRDPDLVARLRGLADQAASAFHNSALLQHVRDQALVDPLTGLPNRALLEDRTRQALLAAARDHHHTCLLFLDLDRFKAINDLHGHATGDELLRLVADRLSRALRASDTLARFGGDEFVILVPAAAAITEAEAVADRVLAALRHPFVVDGHRVTVSCSIGVAASPGDGLDFSSLLDRADVAMYEAKRNGGHRRLAV